MANQYKNEVIYNGQTLISLKDDTITPSKVLSGETFHDRSGAPQTGSMITHNVYDSLDSTSTDDALSANQGRVLNEKYNALNGKKVDIQFSGSVPGEGSVTVKVDSGGMYLLICAHPYATACAFIIYGWTGGAGRVRPILESNGTTVTIDSSRNVTISVTELSGISYTFLRIN